MKLNIIQPITNNNTNFIVIDIGIELCGADGIS